MLDNNKAKNDSKLRSATNPPRSEKYFELASVNQSSRSPVLSQVEVAKNTSENLMKSPALTSTSEREFLEKRLEEVKEEMRPVANDPRYFAQNNNKINRFNDVLALNETRVGEDLNANKIKIGGKYCAIAGQYPLEGQLVNYFKMIVAEKCAGIVVLASEDEIKDPMNKMPNYFGIAGDYNEGVTTSSEKIDTQQLRDNSTMHIYELVIKGCGDDYPVKVFHVLKWPDHGTLSPEAILEANGLVRKMQNEGLPFVHCRAGVGRTGVFIATTALQNDISVQEIVEDMRRSRNGSMVQNSEQLECFVKIALSLGRNLITSLPTEESGAFEQKGTGKSEEVPPPLLPRRDAKAPAPLAEDLITERTISAGQKKIFRIRNLPSQDNVESKVQRIFDNRTPVLTVLTALNEFSPVQLKESAAGFFTQEHEYPSGLKTRSVETAKIQFGELKAVAYSMSISDDKVKINVPVVHIYNWPVTGRPSKNVIYNIVAYLIKLRNKSVDAYQNKGSRAVKDPDKLVPIICRPEGAHRAGYFIDAFTALS
ncbi:protein-tyrosine phosphatase family protein [Erwinia amylovora]|uniref:protein-tyrosine phosphatase family protein n=2 Tax=Erwinia amylovora TaxID=552 RepID=UPI0021004D05|nr:protein-tyrosine phosphatase family protein [Erwinia amylovora]